MIINVDKAVQTYLLNHMQELVGSGTGEIGVYQFQFPDDSQREGVVVRSELRSSHESVSELEPISLRVLVRAGIREEAFNLACNVDRLLDKGYGISLDSDVEMMTCVRNSGPDFFPGYNDNLMYYSALYTMVARYRGNDG